MEQIVITGTGVSPGRAAGTVALMPRRVPEPESGLSLQDETPEAAVVRTAAASAAVRAGLEELAGRAAGDARAVLETTAMMAADPTLLAAAQALVTTGMDPGRAVWQAAGEVMDQLTALGGYMAERARDVADVRDRIVAVLTGRPAPGVPATGPGTRASGG